VTRDDLDLLIHRWFEKTLSPEDEERLFEAIRSDAAAADRFVELGEIESGLVESMRAEADLPEEIRVTARASRRTVRLAAPARTALWPVFAAAGILTALVTLVVLAFSTPAPRGEARRAPEPPADDSVQKLVDEARRKARQEMAGRQARLAEIERERERLEKARTKAIEEKQPELQRQVEANLQRIDTERKEETTKLEMAREELERETPAPPVLTEVKAVAATVERVEGEASLKAGQDVLVGEGLETRGAKSLAVLKFDDGTRLELRGDTSIRDLKIVGGKRVTLSRGILAASVAKQSVGMIFLTSQAEVRVLGTRLTLSLSADATRVEVEEGRVRMKRLPDGATSEVVAGHFAVAARGLPMAPKLITLVRAFQDGVSPTADYAGTRDAAISMLSPTSNLGTQEFVRVHRSNDNNFNALFKWDVSSLPPGSRVISAEITFWVTGAAPGASYRVHELRRPWEELETTWKVYAGSNAWQTPGAQADLDRGTKVLGVLSPGTAPLLYTFPLNDAGIVTVQGWINAPVSNNGIVVTGTALTNAWEFNSRESAPPERRPKLSITYIPGAGR
jgi:ferric-dicitrate binding protein FerR (iron transport regulator)